MREVQKNAAPYLKPGAQSPGRREKTAADLPGEGHLAASIRCPPVVAVPSCTGHIAQCQQIVTPLWDNVHGVEGCNPWFYCSHCPLCFQSFFPFCVWIFGNERWGQVFQLEACAHLRSYPDWARVAEVDGRHRRCHHMTTH